MRLLEFFRPFRIVAQRRVSEEESISFEVFAKDKSTAENLLEGVLAIFRDHRKRTNDEVVRAAQQQLTAIDSTVKLKQDQLADLDAEIAKRKKHPAVRDLSSARSLTEITPGNGKDAS